jgi:hypothetical protein
MFSTIAACPCQSGDAAHLRGSCDVFHTASAEVYGKRDLHTLACAAAIPRTVMVLPDVQPRDASLIGRVRQALVLAAAGS